jgi:hypothetical protein
MPASSREKAAAIARPLMEAEQRNPGVLREKASANLAGKRAEGHAQSDFAIAQRHQTGKGSVQSDCRERDRSEREKRQQKRAKSILCVALGEVLSERHDIKDGTARLDLANLATQRVSATAARDQEQGSNQQTLPSKLRHS